MSAEVIADISRLDSNYADFTDLIDRAGRHESAGRLETAAVYAQAASEHAWLNPGGVFSSLALEQLLLQVGARLPFVEGHSRRTISPTTVLHVITQVYQTGGPTQFVSCWLDQDTDRRHRVCLTRQGATGVPHKLTSRLISHEDLVRLDARPGGLIGRATALRRMASESDVVIVHSHPYDVVPVLAFGGQKGLPPLIFVNHADHVFWIGTSIAETLFSMRQSGADLAVERRGIERVRSRLMMRPLRPAGRTLSRGDAKIALGLPADELLVVTAADGAKYRAVQAPSLLEMIVPVFQKNPKSRMIAAGPSPIGEWLRAEQETSGRIRALGRLPDVSVLQQAADIYLDSFPFSSLTSLLEAGSVGTPVVTYRGHDESCAVLGADTHGLDEYLVRPTDPHALRTALDDLMSNADRRIVLGEQTRRAIVESHTGTGWRQGIGALYVAAAISTPLPTPTDGGRQTANLDCYVNRVMALTHLSEGEPGVLRNNLALLPLGQRLTLAARLTLSGNRPSFRYLLPEWSLAPLARMYRQAKARLQAKWPRST